MKKLSAVLILALVSAFASEVMATIISGNHTTDGGKTVALQGLEWLSFDVTGGYDETAGSINYYNQISTYNRNDIEAGQGGFINTSPETWRYATRVETENLLDSLWGGTNEEYHSSNLDGADWFLKNIAGFNPAPNENYTLFHFGYLPTGNSYNGLVLSLGPDYINSAIQNTGWFRDDYGLSTGTDLVNNQNIIHKSNKYNHLLVREANVSPVPLPGAIWMFGVGLMGIITKAKLKA